MRLKKNPKTGRYSVLLKTVLGERSLLLPENIKDWAKAKAAAANAGLAGMEHAAKVGKLRMDAQSLLLTGKRMTCESAMMEWQGDLQNEQFLSPASVHRYGGEAERFLRANGWMNAPASVITARSISDFIHQAKRLATRQLKLCALTSFIDYCSNAGHIVGNPARKIKRVQVKDLTPEQRASRAPNPYTNDEVMTVLAHLEGKRMDCIALAMKITSTLKAGVNRKAELFRKAEEFHFWKCAVVISRNMGLRIGDIAQLEHTDFSQKAGYAVVWTDKRDKRVEVPVPDIVALYLSEVEMTDERYIWPEQAKAVGDVRNSFTQTFLRAARKAGLVNHAFHDLRSTFIKESLAAGVPMPHISAQVGHSDTAMSYWYLRKLLAEKTIQLNEKAA